MSNNLDLSMFLRGEFDKVQLQQALAIHNNKIDLKITASIENIRRVRQQLQQISNTHLNIGDINGIRGVQTQIANLSRQYNNLDDRTRTIITRNRQWNTSLLDLTRRYMSVYAIIQAINNAKDYVLDVDKALISLKKVTSETDETYRRFLESSNKVAISLGKTSSEVINATASFSKLGYSFKEAQELGKEALLYSNIGDIDVDIATENIVGTLKGFNLEASETRRIIDSINNVSNNFAISAGDVGEALKRSSASMNQANNSLEETIGLYTAGVEILQDPAKVSNALKTISMRIRGVAIDGEEAIPKVRELVRSLSGVEIMESADKFKSTFQVMNELSKVWDSLTDKKKASLLEVIGGKQNAATAAAVLQNMTNGVKAYEMALNSSGSAIKEQERYMQGLEAKISQVNEKFLNGISELVNSELVRWLLDSTSGLLDLTREVGVINVALIALGSTLAVFGGGLGLAVGAIAGLSGGLLSLASAMESTLDERTAALDKQMQNTDETITEMQEIYKLAEEYKNLTSNINDNISSKGALKKAEDLLINKYPELTGLIYDQTNALDTNRKAIESNIVRLQQFMKQGAEKSLFELSIDSKDISKMITEQTKLANTSEKMASKIKESLQENFKKEDYEEVFGVGFNLIAKTYGATSKERVEFEKQFSDIGKLWGKGLNDEEIKEKTRAMYRYFDGINEESTQKVQEYFNKLGDIAELEQMIKDYDKTGKLPELPKTEETKKKVVTDYVYNESLSTTSELATTKQEELKTLDRYYDINNKIAEQQAKINRAKINTDLVDETDYNKRIESINKEIEQTKVLQEALHELNDQRRVEKTELENSINVLSKLNKPTVTQKNEIVELKERLGDLNKVLSNTSNEYMSNEVVIKGLIDRQIDLTEEIKKAKEEQENLIKENIAKYQKHVLDKFEEEIDKRKELRSQIEEDYDNQIKEIEAISDAQEKLNNEKDRELEIEKAKQKLSNVEREKNTRVYTESEGWIWDVNGKEVLTEKENLNDLIKQQQEYDREQAKEKVIADINEQKDKTLEAFDKTTKATESYRDTVKEAFQGNNKDIISYTDLIASIPEEYAKTEKAVVASIEKMRLAEEKSIKSVSDLASKSKVETIRANIPGLGMVTIPKGSEVTLPKGSKILPYANGGINDYTGLAMLHGTPQKPEFIFNNDQIKTFIGNVMSGKGTGKDNGGTTNNYNFSGNIVTPNVTEFMMKMNNLVKTS